MTAAVDVEPVERPVAGAVLCGGGSTRMGRDKATLVVDGSPMAVRAAATLRTAGCAPISAIGGDGPALHSLGLDVIADLHPGCGPLGGIITALRSSNRLAVFVVACDMVWLEPDAVGRVIDALGNNDVAVAVGDRLEPLCAAWSTRTLPLLDERFEAGMRAVHRALEGLRVVHVHVAQRTVGNANSPADLGQGVGGSASLQ